MIRRLFSSRPTRLAMCALLWAPSILAGEPQGKPARVPEAAAFFHYSPAELRRDEAALKPRLNEYKQAAEQLGDFGNATAWIAHREADGLAEVHQNWADLMFVVSGEASLQLGGDIENPYVESPGELRGRAVRGGADRTIRAGDVVNVPAGMQHRFLIPRDGQITFFTMKIAKPQ